MNNQEQKTENKKEFMDDNKVRVGEKPMIVYVNAVMYKMDRYDTIEVTGFGSRVNKTLLVGDFCAKKLRVVKEGVFSIEEQVGDRKIHGIVVKLKKQQ